MQKTVKLGFLLFLLLIFWRLFLPFPLVSTDFHYVFSDTLKLGFNLPQILWERSSDGLGSYSINLLWAWPLDFLYGLGGALNIDFIWLEKLLGLIPAILLSIASIDRLFVYYGIRGISRWVGILFYLVNTYFLLLIDGGQIGIALAFAIVPAVYVSFERLIDNFSIYKGLVFVSYLLLLSIFDIRIIYFLIFLLSIGFLFRLKRNFSINLEVLGKYILAGALGGLVLIGIHFYWILPAVLFKPPTLPLNYGNPGQLSFLSFATIGHGLTAIAPHWPDNIFGKIKPLQFQFLFLPFLVLIIILITRRSKVLAQWLVVTIIGIFLVKGSNYPFGEVYVWLFTYLPGFSLFRDPTKFYFLVIFGYTVILGAGYQTLQKKLSSSWFNFVLGVFVIYLLVVMSPVILGKMHGMFAKPNFKEEYFKLADKLKSDSEYGRILYLPSQPPLGYSSPNHFTLEALRLVEKRPFAIGVVGTYETLNFLREAPYMGEILDISGVKYIAYPYLDPNSRQISFDDIKYYYNFEKQIARQPWVKSTDFSTIPLFVTKKHQDKFFMTDNLWWVVGSDDIYNQATTSAKLNLAKNSMIFPEENIELGEKLQDYPIAKIVLNKKTLVDLAASLLKSQDILFPAHQLLTKPNKEGWWKSTDDVIGWKSFLKEKYNIQNQDFDYGGGWAVNEQNGSLEISDRKITGNKLLLARVMESSKGGDLKFYQNDQLIGSINTLSDNANTLWQKVGDLVDNNKIKITSRGDLNIVNALAVVEKDKWQTLINKVEDLDKSGRVSEFKSTETLNTPAVTYREIDSTKYEVKVSGLNRPSMLVFSENYDPLWRLNSQQPIKVYSMLNGFLIQKNGEYVLEYLPQRYVNLGFWVSAFSFVSLLSLLILFKSSGNKI